MKKLTCSQALKLISYLSAEAAQEDIKIMNNALNNIYKISHITIDECNNKHEDWVKEAVEVYKLLEKEL
jgi:hypothetical protein